MREKDALSFVSIACIFVVTHMSALALALLLLISGMPREDAENPLTPIIYIVLILVFSFLILFIVKKKKDRWIKYIILGSMAYTMFFIFFLPFAYVFLYIGLDPNLGFIPAVALSLGLTYLLFVYPEWYVVDSVGIVVAAGVAAVLGLIFGILPALILLIGLAVYDAISVYKTRHMITLADAVTTQRLPVLLVIPKTRSYSFMKQKGIKEQLDSGEEREATFIGLGDIIIPGVLVVAALIATWGLIVPLCTMLGILAGYAVLMTFVLKGNPQAGLPLLNSGAIIGYIISYVLVYGDLGLGITWPW